MLERLQLCHAIRLEVSTARGILIRQLKQPDGGVPASYEKLPSLGRRARLGVKGEGGNWMAR